MRFAARFTVGTALVLLATAAPSWAQPRPEFPIGCAEGVRPEPLPLAGGLHTFYTVGCAIDGSADTDSFTFNGEAGETVRLTAHAPSSIEPRLELHAPGGAVIADVSCGAGPCTSTTDATLPTAGLYTVVVSDSGGGETGAYVLQLERLAPLYCPPVGDVTAPADTIDPSTDVDWVRFDGRAGDTMRVAVASSGALDPRVEIFDPSGALVTKDSCAGPCTLNVDAVLGTTGGFLAAVADDGGDETGSYDLTVDCLAGACLGSTAVDGIQIDSDRTTLGWDAVTDPNATYDVTRGALADLRAGMGFLGATRNCLASGLIAPTAADPEQPLPGLGFFYVARANGSDGYAGAPDDRWGPGQRCGRQTSLCRGRDCATAVQIPTTSPTAFSDLNNNCGAPAVATDYSNLETTGLCNALLYPGPELIYELQVGAANVLTATLTPDSTTDLGMFFVGDCADPKSCVAFADNPGPGAVTVLALDPLAEGTYYVYVDSYYGNGASSCGEYVFELTGTLSAVPQLVDFRAE